MNLKESEMSVKLTPGEVKHPYVTIDSKIKKGIPIIVGMRTKVMDIAIRYELGGMTPDEIIEQFPHLTLTQIHDALSYYYEHKSELDEAYKKEQMFINELRKNYSSKLKAKFKI